MKQLIIIVLAFIMGMGANKFGCTKKATAPQTRTVNKVKPDTPDMKSIEDVNGITHGRIPEQEYSSITEAPITYKYITYVNDTLAPALKIASDKITELTRVNATLEGKLIATNKAVKRLPDNTEKEVTYWRDKYFEAMVIHDTLKYKYNAVLDIVAYEQGSPWFGQRKKFVDISSPDTNLRVQGVERYKKQIDFDKYMWLFGAETGVYIAPNYSMYNGGLRLKYNPQGIFSPQISTGILTQSGGRWQPYISVKTDINFRRW